MGKPDTIIKIDGSAICSGIERMVAPPEALHIRAAEIRVPLLFKGKPAVISTAHAMTGPGVIGAVYGIFNIKVNQLPAIDPQETQVVIQATNVHSGEQLEGDFDLDYVIIGEIA